MDSKNKVVDHNRTIGTVRNEVKFAWFPKAIENRTYTVWFNWYREHKEWDGKKWITTNWECYENPNHKL